MCSAGKVTSCDGRVRSDPRLIERVGRDYAEHHGVYPLRRVGALTLVAARDMWARLDTVDHLEATLGPVTFVDVTPS